MHFHSLHKKTANKNNDGPETPQKDRRKNIDTMDKAFDEQALNVMILKGEPHLPPFLEKGWFPGHLGLPELYVPSRRSLGIVVQVLGDVVHQLTLGGLVGHGLVQLACHQGLGHALLPALPEEDRHLLALHQHSPHHQLVEGVLESTHSRVIHINVQLLLLFLLLLFLPFGWWLVILRGEKHLYCGSAVNMQ